MGTPSTCLANSSVHMMRIARLTVMNWMNRSLAQSALRLEEIHQSLQANVYGSARDMQLECVSKSIQELRKNNAGLQKQIQGLRQRVRSHHMSYSSIYCMIESLTLCVPCSLLTTTRCAARPRRRRRARPTMSACSSGSRRPRWVSSCSRTTSTWSSMPSRDVAART